MSKMPNQLGIGQTPGQWAPVCCKGASVVLVTPSHLTFFRAARAFGACDHTQTHTQAHSPVSNHFGDIHIKSGNQPVLFTRNLYLLLLLVISC